MIIVEGADNTGKSTLVEQLLKLDPTLTKVEREKFKPNKGETIGAGYMRTLIPKGNMNFAQHSNSIVDRLFASECIYGNLYRDGCRMSFAEHNVIKALMMQCVAMVIFCNPPNEAILKSWREREQLYDRDPLLIAHEYREKVRHIFDPIPVFEYDWTKSDALWQRKCLVAHHREMLVEPELPLGWHFTSPCYPDIR